MPKEKEKFYMKLIVYKIPENEMIHNLYLKIKKKIFKIIIFLL